MQVMVVDMNNGFTKKGNLYSPRVGALVEPMTKFLSKFPARNRVVFLSDSHDLNDRELLRFPNHCIKGSGEELIRPELIKACVDYEIFYKSEHDIFTCVDEGTILNELDNEWIVVGCVTDICVEAAVGGLIMRGQKVIVVKNLIDTFHSESHHSAKINNFWIDYK